MISLVKMGGAPMLSKLGIKSAFRVLPLASSEFPLLGMRFDGNIYINAFLPSIFQLQDFSGVLQRFFSCANSSGWYSKCGGIPWWLFNYQWVHAYCEIWHGSIHQISSPNQSSVAHDKTAGPSPALVFWGIELDCTDLEARLPVDKVMKAEKLIQWVLQSNKIWHKQIESLHGYLNYCSQIISAGWAFLRFLIQSVTCSSQMGHITTPDQTRPWSMAVICLSV